MQIRKNGDFYIGTHITGPTHNFLKMRVGLGLTDGARMTVHSAVDGCSHGTPLKADETLDWIEGGIERANAALGSSLRAIEIEIIANDSRRPEVYAELARRIIVTAYEDLLKAANSAAPAVDS